MRFQLVTLTLTILAISLIARVVFTGKTHPIRPKMYGISYHMSKSQISENSTAQFMHVPHDCSSKVTTKLLKSPYILWGQDRQIQSIVGDQIELGSSTVTSGEPQGNLVAQLGQPEGIICVNSIRDAWFYPKFHLLVHINKFDATISCFTLSRDLRLPSWSDSPPPAGRGLPARS